MLELSALGLLQRHPLHGYRLKQELELFMSSCMSVNYGAIYPLLKRLEGRGHIAPIARESGDAGPSRTIYGITPTGRDRWRQKMLEHPQDSWVKSRARFAIKFFFFSDLEPEARQELMEHRLVLCRARYKSFREKPLPEDCYQVAVWNRHLDVLKSEIKWVQEQIALELQQQGSRDTVQAKVGRNHPRRSRRVSERESPTFLNGLNPSINKSPIKIEQID